MRFPIVSYESVGPLRFGMRLHQIEECLGKKADVFRGFGDSKLARALLENTGVFVDFVYPDVSVAYELTLPAKPYFEQHSLLEESADSLFAWLKGFDADWQDTVSGPNFFSLGLSIYAPNFDDEPNSPPESVLVFERGYWD